MLRQLRDLAPEARGASNNRPRRVPLPDRPLKPLHRTEHDLVAELASPARAATTRHLDSGVVATLDSQVWSLDDVERCLNHCNKLQAFKRGANRPLSRRDVGAALQSGWTVQVPSAQDVDVEINRLCGEIRCGIGGFHVRANIYLSLPGSPPASSPHVDPSPAFVLQLFGSKLWSVWSPIEPDSLPSWIAVEDEQHAPPKLDESRRTNIELFAGELLHLRRGDPHMAWPGDGPDMCAQVTFMTFPSTLGDVLRTYLSFAEHERGDEILRRTIPGDQRALAELLDGLLPSLADEVRTWLPVHMLRTLSASSVGEGFGPWMLPIQDRPDLAYQRSSMPARTHQGRLAIPGGTYEIHPPAQEYVAQTALLLPGTLVEPPSSDSSQRPTFNALVGVGVVDVVDA